MLIKLRDILNTYSRKELEDMELWVNSDFKIDTIIINDWTIDLISENTEIKIDDAITKEKKEE